MSEPIRAYLVANARYHDTDFARLELLKLLAEHPDIRTRVAEDFSDTAGIGDADLLITYTCD
ncbi:MAG: ThuA domain-containing protein, partial [Acidimicrobiia bacterium]|nr:ThuA domain-containing protein [Acidimicrobiia bacterium]